ncbi:3-deoxy-D-manno-octulosonic acid transferase [Paragemmobacter straminiformis]|uniref:3-deoxy-D-manno-octulosonic acid transferase n=1 Tax=Paragemmobacter straminiformis TaxID=2045119 RepID=A0A842I930_9RHOB|nr:glycosyltransferase N-terminal domain-containing protein [Gemmobacter straminiformis]MBC2836126.1 3-deoxy-D-manno-octulosonic acid transferase [Gemmobacter straminiformis]
MAYSLGLTFYNLSNRRDAGQAVDRPPRPLGRLVWLHAPNAEVARSMLELARRLIDEDGLPVLLTCPAEIAPRAGLILQRPPADTPAEARAFLDHWAPEIALFSEGELRPALLHEANERKLPVLMVAGRMPYILRERDGWYPGLMRGLLATFRHVLTIDEASARAFRKAGASLSAVEVTGKMEEESAALPHLEAEREALARQLATRPVWLAASLPEAEEAAAITAHRAALRLAHRLLLIIVPEDPARAEPLAARMAEAEGWTVARRSEDQEPDTETEVYIADNAQEFGLWYRLAPITFMGGSLSGQGCIRDPLEPAALGSAILYGPRPGLFGTTFGRLGAARAARAVGSPTDLAEALGDLLSPDRAARLAQAAWAVTSDGAEVTDKVHLLIRNITDGE